MDELTEFKKSVLEVLRQPLEEKRIHLSRTSGNYVFPADFMLVAAMNPCPCGNYPDQRKCLCTPWQIQQYLGKISQPFLDRIDMCTEASKITYADIRQKKEQESSETIRDRVIAARKIQRERLSDVKGHTNARMGIREIQSYCNLGEKEEVLMNQVFSTLGLTARTYHKILKVARTIADLDGEERIGMSHLKEAIGYRTMDKKYWGR